MKFFTKIFILFLIILIICNCSINRRISDSEIEIRAKKIAAQFDSTNIDIFKTWGFMHRGQSGVWFKNSGDSSLYRCIYNDLGDSSKLSVIEQEYFIKDFGVDLFYDTAYWRINIWKQSNGLIKIIGVNNHGQDVLLITNVDKDSIFKQLDTFEKFKDLTELKDSLKIIGINYYERLGGFIQFYLSPYHILTYIPSYDLLNPEYKQIWIDEFDKGTMIQKHWNLRKLEKPIDNG